MKVTFDSSIFTYLVLANSGQYSPPNDPQPELAHERVAALRVFLYYDILVLLPTVANEVKEIRDKKWRGDHEEFERVHLVEIPWLDPRKVEALAGFYLGIHPEKEDCLIVAEAELFRVDFLLTNDMDLVRRMDGKSGYTLVVTPSWFWSFLKVPRGTTPKWVPHPTPSLLYRLVALVGPLDACIAGGAVQDLKL